MKKLSRRQFLRGAGGVAFSLPFLHSLQVGADPIAPRRFVFFYHPNGVDTPTFWPTAGATESDFSLGLSQAALEPWKSKLLWIGGLDMGAAVSGPGEQHQRGIGALLTGDGLNTGSFVGNDGSSAGWAKNISLDQALRPLIGGATPIASLQLGVNVRKRDVSGTLSYSGNNGPLLPENDPRQTYRSLFFTTGPSREESPLYLMRRQSVLDSVNAQLKAMKKRVSAADAQRLDEHATLVRELEIKIDKLPPPVVPPMSPPVIDPTDPTMPPAPTGPTGITGYTGQDYPGCEALGEPTISDDDPESVDAMAEMAYLQVELAALALRCDLTRVVTLCFADAQDHISMPFLDVQQDIHNLSHLADGDTMRVGLRKRDMWQAQQFVHLMERLQAAQEMDGSTVLDNSLLMWGSELSKGNTHSHSDMPFILAGGGAGFRMNRYIRYNGRQHNDLLLAILQAFGGAATTFGNPTFNGGALDNLY